MAINYRLATFESKNTSLLRACSDVVLVLGPLFALKDQISVLGLEA